MRHLLYAVLFFALLAGISGDVMAQKKKTSSKKSKKKEAVVEAPAYTLPYNSNDCLFAIELKTGEVVGPTSAPSGAGRIMEVASSIDNPNVVDHEHNSVWYKYTVPYNGLLEIDVAQLDPTNDYDMMVYRYTGTYFSNNLIQGKIKPVASNLAQVDTNYIKKASGKKGAKGGAATAAKGKAGAKKSASSGQPLRMLGMKHDAKNYFVPKSDTTRDCKSIQVHAGETYYILLDNLKSNGGGHTIKASLYVEKFKPVVQFIDPGTKKPTDVDLVIVEKNTNNQTVVKNSAYKGGRVEFVPGFTYTLYAKKKGYFTVYREFNSNMFMTDTMLSITLNKAAKGSTFSVEGIYFNTEGTQLLEGADSVLSTYVQLFTNQPDVTFMIKGYVATYGEVTMESDQEESLARAVTIKNYFISNGIGAERMTVSGMTPSEIKKAGINANNPKIGLIKKRCDLIVTSVPSSKK